MAEVSRRTGNEVHDIAVKMYKRYLMDTRNKVRKRTVHVSSLAARFSQDDIKKHCSKAAEREAYRLKTGGSQDSYTRVKQLYRCVETGMEKGNNADNNYSNGLDKHNTIIVKKKHIIIKNYLFWRTSISSSQQGCGGHVLFIRKYSGNGTRSEPLYKTKTGYYEILEVPPSATHAQIKTAYYKQSFAYHPDRNAGSDDATVRFSEISEAYTVLGNKGLRKKYDRGLLSLSDLTATVKPHRDATSKPEPGKRSMATTGSRGGMFDFDSFFKSHYNEQLQRQREIKIRKEEILKKQEEAVEEKKMGRMMEIGVGILLVFALGILLSFKRS